MKLLKWGMLGIFWIIVIQVFFYLSRMATNAWNVSDGYGWAGIVYLSGFVLIVAGIILIYTRITNSRSLAKR